MLSTQKLMEACNISYETHKNDLNFSRSREVYQTGFYNGYLLSQKLNPVKPKKSKTSTGRLATVGVGKPNGK